MKENSPYEGGKYEVDIVIPESYPFSAPKMRFITLVGPTAIVSRLLTDSIGCLSIAQEALPSQCLFGHGKLAPCLRLDEHCTD